MACISTRFVLNGHGRYDFVKLLSYRTAATLGSCSIGLGILSVAWLVWSDTRADAWFGLILISAAASLGAEAGVGRLASSPSCLAIVPEDDGVVSGGRTARCSRIPLRRSESVANRPVWPASDSATYFVGLYPQIQPALACSVGSPRSLFRCFDVTARPIFFFFFYVPLARVTALLRVFSFFGGSCLPGLFCTVLL